MADLMTHKEMATLFKEAAEEKKLEKTTVSTKKSSSSTLSANNIVIEKDVWNEAEGYTVYINFHKILQRWVAFGEAFEKEEDYTASMKRFKDDFSGVLGCVNIFVVDDEKKQKQIQSKGRSEKCRRIVLGEGKEEKEKEAGEEKPKKREPLALEEEAEEKKETKPPSKKKGKK